MGKIWCVFVGQCKAIALPCVGLNDLELDGYGIHVHVSSIRLQSSFEFKIGMMLCCFDAEYVCLLNVLHGMNFFPSSNALLHPGNPLYSRL